MNRTARIFANGGSQAVRLPAEFRFDTDVVYVRRDLRSGDVILSSRPTRRWADFAALRDEIGPLPPDEAGAFDERPMNPPAGMRDPFAAKAGATAGTKTRPKAARRKAWPPR